MTETGGRPMRIKILSAALLLALPCHKAAAVDIGYTLELGLEHSDNINLSETAPISETTLIPRIGFSLVENGSTVQADVQGSLEYLHYLGNAYANETRTELDASVNWWLVPERLSWIFADNLELAPVDLREPSEPQNLQRANVFTTGPTLHLQHSRAMSSQLELRYIDTYAEVSSEFDSTRVFGAYRIMRETSPNNRFSLNLEMQDTNFDDDLLALDYRNYSAYVGYTHSFTDLLVNAALGYTWIDFDAADEASGPLARLSLEWTVTPLNRLRASMAWQYSDAATSMTQGAALPDIGLGGVQVGGDNITPDIYEETFADASHIFENARWTVETHLYAGEYRHEQATPTSFDRDERGGTFSIAYRLRPLVSAGVQFGLGRTDYVGTEAYDRNNWYGLYFEQRFSRHWSWRADLARNEREARGRNDSPSYDENIVFVRVVYTR